MTTPVEIAAIVTPGALLFAALGTVAVAREWVNVTVSVSVKAVPAAKRKPRNAVELVHVVPGTVEPAATVEPITAARKAAS
jgi:hypothetical protein